MPGSWYTAFEAASAQDSSVRRAGGDMRGASKKHAKPKDRVIAALNGFVQRHVVAPRATQPAFPVHQTDRELHRLGEILNQAAKDPDPVVYAAVLQRWLKKRGIKWPRGVFHFDAYAKRRGRPRKLDEGIDLLWESYQYEAKHGRKPSAGWLARKFRPAEYERDPKRAADAVRTLMKSTTKYLDRKASHYKPRG